MKLEKFMFCMTLETIGLAIGFFGIFVSGLTLLLTLVGGTTIILLFSSSNEVDRFIGNNT